ncbi:MAG: insulinase family protein [Candidatus Nomurabacteria bacterium]|jgi:predicted Zn-dependent peptidase|nr:insulinase family protein [Candidatus Nomurabacteria bacterium]
MKHDVKEVILRNGARGLIINVPDAPVVATQFHFRAGERYAKEGKDQTAHIMEHMAFGANAEYANAHAFDEDFTKNGAYNNAWTTDYSMCYVAECAGFEWDRILNLQRLTICSPKFIADEFTAEMGNVKSELTGYLNEPNRVLWPKIGQELGEKTLTISEKIDSLSNITLPDIRAHYRATHTAENMRFVVAGDFDRKESQLTRILNNFDLDSGERLSIPVDEIHSFEPFAIRRKDVSNITFGLTINLSRRISDSEATAMSCLDHILNGTLHGLILGTARKRGLLYDIWSITSRYEHNSSWDFGAEVNIDKIDELFDIIARELTKIKKGELDEKFVEASKLYALGRHQMSNQTVGQLSRWYGQRYFFDGSTDSFENSLERIERLSTKQIIAAAKEFFDANTWGIGIYGSVDKTIAERLHAKLRGIFE